MPYRRAGAPAIPQPANATLIEYQAAIGLAQVWGGEPWLFPGIVPGRPISQTGLSSKLLSHGIDTRPARNAALVALSGDLPETVLASILGLHPNTAVRWAGFAKTSWGDYLAARARDIQTSPGRATQAGDTLLSPSRNATDNCC